MAESRGDSEYLEVQQKEEFVNEEFDFSLIFIVFLKNAKKITIFGFIGFIIACIFAFTTKKTWQGDFQIVLETDNNSLNLSNSMMGTQSLLNYSNLLGINSGSQSLKTQVEILKSPSVLLNIFDYVIKQKGLGDFTENQARFKDWKTYQLDIKLQKNTSILNIKYEDTSKELILPVLKKISKAYQIYSGSQRNREIDLANKYFEEQISFYKIKSNKSLREFQEFAIDNDVPINLSDKVEMNPESDLNFESQRVKAANEIRFLNNQLTKLKLIPDDSDEIFYFALNIPEIRSSNNITFSNLNELMYALPSKSAIYTEKDILIKTISEKKLLLLKELKLQMLGYFNSAIQENSAIIKATSRSKETILTYMDLFKNANRDNKTLNTLENQLRLVKLEQSRYKDPWKLITEPTVLPYAIKPKKKNIAFFGGFSGLILGSLIMGFFEKKNGIIYTEKGLNNILKGSFSEKIYFDDIADWKNKIQPINRTIINKFNDEILFLILGNFSDEKIKEIEEKIAKNIEIKNFKISNDTTKVFDYNNLVLISYLGITNISEMKLISKNLSLQKKSILGHLTFYDNIRIIGDLKFKNNFA